MSPEERKQHFTQELDALQTKYGLRLAIEALPDEIFAKSTTEILMQRRVGIALQDTGDPNPEETMPAPEERIVSRNGTAPNPEDYHALAQG